MRNAVQYKGVWLMRGSRAHELHEAGDMAALGKHFWQLTLEAHHRGDVPMRDNKPSVLPDSSKVATVRAESRAR
jgi:hypothetical protein